MQKENDEVSPVLPNETEGYECAKFKWWDEENQTGISQDSHLLGSLGRYVELKRKDQSSKQIENDLRDFGPTKSDALKPQLKDAAARNVKFEMVEAAENIMLLFFEKYACFEQKKILEWKEAALPIDIINQKLKEHQAEIKVFFIKYLERIFSKGQHTFLPFHQIQAMAPALLEGGLDPKDYTQRVDVLLGGIKKFNRITQTRQGIDMFTKGNKNTKDKIIHDDPGCSKHNSEYKRN